MSNERGTLTNEALVDAWRDAQRALPDDRELCGVVYHGPDRDPGSEWVAFCCDANGTLDPEGQGGDPVSALRDLVEATLASRAGDGPGR
jgi:hypothetical protein